MCRALFCNPVVVTDQKQRQKEGTNTLGTLVPVSDAGQVLEGQRCCVKSDMEGPDNLCSLLKKNFGEKNVCLMGSWKHCFSKGKAERAWLSHLCAAKECNLPQQGGEGSGRAELSQGMEHRDGCWGGFPSVCHAHGSTGQAQSNPSTRGVYRCPTPPNPPSHVRAHPTFCGSSLKRTRRWCSPAAPLL